MEGITTEGFGVLPNLEIRNFRAFSHLTIERLGRVNLIVGKNGVGKTTLLESLQLYGSNWPGRIAPLILYRRDEIAGGGGLRTFPVLPSLFHGRDAGEGTTAVIGPISDQASLPKLKITAKIADRLETFGQGRLPSGAEPSFWPDIPLEVNFVSGGLQDTLHPGGVMSFARSGSMQELRQRDPGPPFLRGIQGGNEIAEVAWQWDRIGLTESEKRVLGVLQIVSPIEAISFVGEPQNVGGRVAKVRVAGSRKPIPLAVLGDGAVRMFQVAVALEYAAIAAGVESDSEPPRNVFPLLLIDEVEIGIHYSLHVDLWRFILKAARDLGVQVFATTHSWDCIQGFQQAAAEDDQDDAVLIRLESGKDKSRAFLFNEEELAVVTREQIEVR